MVGGRSAWEGGRLVVKDTPKGRVVLWRGVNLRFCLAMLRRHHRRI